MEVPKNSTKKYVPDAEKYLRNSPRDKVDKRLWTLSIVGRDRCLDSSFCVRKIEQTILKQDHSTMEYIKDQYSMYSSFNEAVEARSLVRMVEKVHDGEKFQNR